MADPAIRGNFEPLFSDAQKGILEIVTLISAPFSVVGSAVILWTIVWDRRKKLRSTYHRQMLGLSFLDLVSSAGVFVFGPWAVPSDTGSTLLARGTFGTCAAAGFFMNFLFGTMFYSMFLALYFLLLIRFAWREETIAKYLEPWAHFWAFVFPIVTGTVALRLDAIGPVLALPGFCWIHDYPFFCALDADVECEGASSKSYFRSSTVLNGLIISILFFVIVIAMLMLILKVRATEKQLRRYAGGQNAALVRTKETAYQALLYIASFFLVFFPIALIQFTGRRRTRLPAFFAIALLTKAVAPLQGFLNAIIYLRNQYSELTKPGQSLAWFRKIPVLRRWTTAHVMSSRSTRVNHTSLPKQSTGTVVALVAFDSPQEQGIRDIRERSQLQKGSPGVAKTENYMHPGSLPKNDLGPNVDLTEMDTSVGKVQGGPEGDEKWANETPNIVEESQRRRQGASASFEQTRNLFSPGTGASPGVQAISGPSAEHSNLATAVEEWTNEDSEQGRNE